MRLLVISDTHGNYHLALRACDLAEPVDAVIHLGDGGEDAGLLSHILGDRLIRVVGNCDHRSAGPGELLWECEGKRLLLVHGDRYGVKNGLARLEQRGIETRADVILFGHTHCAMIDTLSGILFVNPGTLMHSDRQTTYAILDITPAGVTARLHDID
ncbi:MAG TPA: metallophosphoesterase [Desulfuromonadaceae bacterium]